MLYLAIILCILGIVLLGLASRRQKASGLPAGRIIYSDTQFWKPVEKPLYDPELGLTGRPDYLVQEDNQIIPIEVKSGRAPENPYDSHLYQLAAYCHLVQITYNIRPANGILHYSNRTFAVDYTPELEVSLKNILEAIRGQERQKEISRSHQSPARCQGCGYRSICTQSLERDVSTRA